MAACPRLIAYEDFDLWRYPSMPHILKMCNNRPSIASSTHQRLPASKTPHPQLCQPAEAVCHMLSHHFRETTLSLNWIRHSPWIRSTTWAACTMIEWSAQELNNRGTPHPHQSSQKRSASYCGPYDWLQVWSTTWAFEWHSKLGSPGWYLHRVASRYFVRMRSAHNPSAF
jgi:hypothetical protein